MKRLTASFLAAGIFLALRTLPAAAKEAPAQTAQSCAAKYPVVLVHGAAFRDKTLGLNYWGRIPGALQAGGAQVYYGGTDGWGSVEGNAAQLGAQIQKILAQTGAKKVNIIAHSKGGLEARYMISSLGMAGKVASLTTISTPHRGSKAIDWLVQSLPDGLLKFAGTLENAWCKLIGDKNPDFYHGVLSMTTAAAAQFNLRNPNVSGVYYQSYAGEMKRGADDLLLCLPWALVHRRDSGPSDGCVSVESAKWGVFKGTLRGTGGRGVSHADEVDARRVNLHPFGAKDSSGVNDVRDVYTAIARDLKAQGN